ncbi:phosphomannomutase [Vibrio mediterranei]|uniref:phosphomannomutase n=1 Tax=Vibrio mediterranei TaxID=689 RepID=UPI001EFDA003|nr:phosphomannomutase [Vibrio mediterranei]MCG9666037.1 phosphomannomutase [Vibrio mediterranei]
MLISKNVIQASGVQFGTSGARGLVEQFSPDTCAAFTYSFLASLSDKFTFEKVAVAIDNRPSSPAMAQACIAAIEGLGLDALYYGVIPTPALAYQAMQLGIPCIMVTGSHIPFDRNGLKFYRPDSEITKVEEQAILNNEVQFEPIARLPVLSALPEAAINYIQRYTSLFSSTMLKGWRIGIYEHSSAGRDLYPKIFERLGAEVVPIERSDEFVPIDTEAVSEADKAKALEWSEKLHLDFIFSTDGDGDRPLVADESGNWLRGDILGLICAKAMQLDALAIPVSCNTSVELSECFSLVSRTKIGSPYVIAAFEDLANHYSTFAGFEANGGFLLGSDASVGKAKISALPTRDAVLPALMLLSYVSKGQIGHLVHSVSKRFTDSDRIQQFPTSQSQEIIRRAQSNPSTLLSLLGVKQDVVNFDLTDGLRMTLVSGDVAHLRPSGNAPELRCYAESSTMERATSLVELVLTQIKELDPKSI